MNNDWELIGRVAVAAVLGFAIGWEREVRGHAAGSRTLSLVASGAAAFTALSVDMFPSSAEKLIAGIVTGVGFIGAGVVLHDQGQTRGLTTAAAVWAIAAVGVLAGAGRVVLAMMFTVIIFVTLELQHLPGARFLEARRYVHRFRDDDSEPPSG